MKWSRDRHVAAVDAYEFPSSIRRRFAFTHETLAENQIATVESGTRQWFRVAARNPKAKLAMPSVAVDDMWHEFVLHTREYAEFCDTALGRFLHHVPDSADPAGDHGAQLQATLRLAQQDEGCATDRLPLLFRVDRELSLPDGRRYLADCGGRGTCHQLKGATCVFHVTGSGRSPLARRGYGQPPDYPHMEAPGGQSGCGGG